VTNESSDELLRKLDLIQATLRLAFSAQINEVGAAVRSDRASASILDLAQDWIGTTQLQMVVAEKTGLSARSVRDRLADLRAQGLVVARGSEQRPEYRSTGLV